jgi:hypothetical protein
VVLVLMLLLTRLLLPLPLLLLPLQHSLMQFHQLQFRHCTRTQALQPRQHPILCNLPLLPSGFPCCNDFDERLCGLPRGLLVGQRHTRWLDRLPLWLLRL